MKNLLLKIYVLSLCIVFFSCTESKATKEDSNIAIYQPKNIDELGQCVKTLLFDMVNEPIQNAENIFSKYFITKNSFEFVYPNQKQNYKFFFEDRFSIFQYNFNNFKSINPENVKEIKQVEIGKTRALFKVMLIAIISTEIGEKEIELNVYFSPNKMNGKQISYYPVNDVKIKIN